MALKTLLAFVLVPAALAAPATLKRTFTPEPDTIPWSVRGLTRSKQQHEAHVYHRR